MTLRVFLHFVDRSLEIGIMRAPARYTVFTRSPRAAAVLVLVTRFSDK